MQAGTVMVLQAVLVSGSMRDYVMEKIKSPCITLEIGVAGCPLPISQFSSIWRKNESLVLREQKLLL